MKFRCCHDLIACVIWESGFMTSTKMSVNLTFKFIQDVFATGPRPFQVS